MLSSLFSDAATLWWLVAGGLVIAELFTGTFYLLMLALGAGAAALTAHAGWSLTAQVVTAAVVGSAATAAWHLRRARHPRAAEAPRNPDVLLDIGAEVTVGEWGADGTARVHYRGAAWRARLDNAAAPKPGLHRIAAIDGSELRLVPVD
jgi:membrane protein implicated in regulation of membrane protease activity